MKMKELFDRGEFVVSAEVGPPKGIHVDELVEEAKTYLKDVHAVNVTDNQSSVMRLGSLAMCKVLKDAGMNTCKVCFGFFYQLIYMDSFRRSYFC